MCRAGEYLDLLQQTAGIQGAGEELQAAGTNGGKPGRRIRFAVAEEQQWQLRLESLLDLLGQPQAFAWAVEIDFHDDGGRVAAMHSGAKRRDIAERLRRHTEEVQLTHQMLSALLILQCDVHRFAQRWQEGLVVRVVMAQAGPRQAVDQLAERRYGAAGQAAAVVPDVAEAILDVQRQLGMLGLLEAVGKSPKAGGRFGKGRMVAIVPFAALQLLPDFEHLASLMNDPLGKVLLEFFLIRHDEIPVHPVRCLGAL